MAAPELSEAERVRVEAFGLDKPEPNYHTVTVATRPEYDEDLGETIRVVDSVKFVCTAPPDADCRAYPDCDCEVWRWDESGLHDEAGHDRVQGKSCWLTDWFGNGYATYAGADADDMRDDYVPAVDRTGQISTRCVDEWVEWDFTDRTEVVA